MSPFVTFPLLVLARALDWGSTALVTPTLKYEANAYVRNRSTRRGIVYEVLFCAICSLWTPAAVMVCIASTLIAATNLCSVGIETNRTWPIWIGIVPFAHFAIWVFLAVQIIVFKNEPFGIFAGIVIFATLRLMFAK